MRNEFINKLIEGMVRIYSESMKDEMIYGSSFVEFSDRKIEVLDPIEKLKKIGRKIVKRRKTEMKKKIFFNIEPLIKEGYMYYIDAEGNVCEEKLRHNQVIYDKFKKSGEKQR